MSVHAFLYIVRCADGSLFTGTAGDVEEALRRINQGEGETYTKTRLPVFMAYSEEFMNASDAEKRAAEVRSMPRREKERIVGSIGVSGVRDAFAESAD